MGKPRRPQAKDIADAAVLKTVARRDGPARAAVTHDELMRQPWATGLPAKVVRAKMAALIRRGLVDGCACGCRGDYVITKAGLALVRSAGKEAR